MSHKCHFESLRSGATLARLWPWPPFGLHRVDFYYNFIGREGGRENSVTSFKGPCPHATSQVPTSKCGHIGSLCVKGKRHFNPPHTGKWRWTSAFTAQQCGRQCAGCHADGWVLSYSQLPPSNFCCGHHMKEHQTQGDKTNPVNRSLICGNYFTFVGLSPWDSPFSFALNTWRGLNFLLVGRILVCFKKIASFLHVAGSWCCFLFFNISPRLMSFLYHMGNQFWSPKSALRTTVAVFYLLEPHPELYQLPNLESGQYYSWKFTNISLKMELLVIIICVNSYKLETKG